jgi:hypothetical protein
VKSFKTEQYKKIFLQSFAKTGNVSKSCEITGIGRTVVYQEWLTKDPEFAADFEIAKRVYIDRLEAECDRRAMEGIDKPVLWQGRITDTYKEYSDTLLMFRMKKLDPSYRENSQIQINNNQVDVKRIVYHFDGQVQEPGNQINQ